MNGMFEQQRFAGASMVMGFALALLQGCASSDGSGGNDENAARVLDPSRGANVVSGTLRRWGEASAHLNVDFGEDGAPSVALGLARTEGLVAFWSIATTHKTRPDANTGFFYADGLRARKEARVARAEGLASITDLTNASSLAYSTESVGPVPIGGVVVIEHAQSGRYLALVLDAIETTDPHTAGAGPFAYADVRWYLSAEGSADFSTAR